MRGIIRRKTQQWKHQAQRCLSRTLRYAGTDGAETTIGAVRDRESCDPMQGGWYFDNAEAPTRIIACQQSCQRLNELNGEIKALLGCPTVVVAADCVECRRTRAIAVATSAR